MNHILVWGRSLQKVTIVYPLLSESNDFRRGGHFSILFVSRYFWKILSKISYLVYIRNIFGKKNTSWRIPANEQKLHFIVNKLLLLRFNMRDYWICLNLSMRYLTVTFFYIFFILTFLGSENLFIEVYLFKFFFIWGFESLNHRFGFFLFLKFSS